MIKKSLVVFFLIFLVACGIDDVVFLEPPEVGHNPTGYMDDDKKYFEIKATNKKNLADSMGYFKGTDVFYKIYEKGSSCTYEVEQAKKYAESNPSNSANYLTSTFSFKFLSYGDKNSQERPLIKSETDDVNIRFRLLSYGLEKSELSVDGVSFGLVKRENGKNFEDISQSDNDVKKETSESGVSDTELYVAFFVASYGTDKYFKPIYSKIIYIGYIKIDKPY